jgi:hypothetical protein
VAEPLANSNRRDAQSSKSLPDIVSDLWELTVTYAKQQTIDPLRGLGRFLGFGVAGAVCLAIGVILLLLAGLRALQTQTGDTFGGNFSWAPYAITLVGGVLVMAIGISRISKRKGPGA